MGLDREFVVKEVLSSPVSSSAMHAKGTAIESGDAEVHFPLEWMLKDLRLAGEVLPQKDGGVLEAATAMFDEGVRKGLGRRDFSAIHTLPA